MPGRANQQGGEDSAKGGMLGRGTAGATPSTSMPLNKSEKEQILADLTSDLKEAKGIVFTDYRGLTVKEFEDLRARMREQCGFVKVAKLTLVRRALKALGINIELNPEVPTALAYSKEDEVAPAKIVVKFANDVKKTEVVSGLLNGKLLSSAEVKALSKLPGRQELRGQVVSVLAGPMRGFVGVMAGVQRSLLYTLKAYAEKKTS